jgi:hypothetical protein
MAFTEDPSEFLDNDYGFSVEAVYEGVTINGIFDHEYYEDTVGMGAGMQARRPVFLCLESDVSEAAHGDVLEIGDTTYHVAGIEPDGTGMVRLMLEEQ